jgi:large subunit ribosomal protein L23
MMNDIVLKPRISEKAYGLSQKGHVYVFDVPLTANKLTVAQAVASQFTVAVDSVNIVVMKGKAVRSYRKRSKAINGKRNNLKKAYVTLQEGNSIPIFESDEPKTSKKASAKKDKETK